MRLTFIAFFSALFLNGFAQITVTSATFPVAGDTLRFAFDRNPSESLINAITPPGGGQNWDLSALKAEDTAIRVYRPASAGKNAADFPGADVVVTDIQGDTYFNVTANKFESLGYAGLDPANLGLNVVTKFSPPVTERRSPMNFFDINQQTTDLSLPFSVKDLPAAIKDNVPGLNLADSIRIRINFQRLTVVDGWGNATIPGKTYPVLREKRTEYTQTQLDVHTFLGWIPVPTQTLGQFGALFGVDTTVSYRFYNDKAKEEIAILTLNNELNAVVSARFKSLPTTTAASADAPEQASISAEPNPASDWTRFQCVDLPRGDYALEIFNIAGKLMWRKPFADMSGDASIQVELGDFDQGVYLYRLVNKRGEATEARRLLVLKQ